MVGEEETLFTISRELLCSRSKYFDRAFNGPWIEAQEGVMTLPEDRPSAFEVLIHWVIHDTVPAFAIPDKADNRVSLPDRFARSAEILRDYLVPAYCLAQKLCIEDLRNKIMDAIQDYSQDNDTVMISWVSAPSPSPPRSHQ